MNSLKYQNKAVAEIMSTNNKKELVGIINRLCKPEPYYKKAIDQWHKDVIENPQIGNYLLKVRALILANRKFSVATGFKQFLTERKIKFREGASLVMDLISGKKGIALAADEKSDPQNILGEFANYVDQNIAA